MGEIFLSTLFIRLRILLLTTSQAFKRIVCYFIWVHGNVFVNRNAKNDTSESLVMKLSCILIMLPTLSLWILLLPNFGSQFTNPSLRNLLLCKIFMLCHILDIWFFIPGIGSSRRTCVKLPLKMIISPSIRLSHCIMSCCKQYRWWLRLVAVNIVKWNHSSCSICVYRWYGACLRL